MNLHTKRHAGWCGIAALVAMACIMTSGCQPCPATLASTTEPVIPNVVTADIAAGIERHIELETQRGGGYFLLPYENEMLRLKLVRVHLEYLANLGPRRHFACVDLASTEGDVYDVDFFLSGDPGEMVVTETTIHKLNGQPFYLWKQQDDGTWARTDVDDASRELLGVIDGSDRFEFLYTATLPPLGAEARMWLPLPESDAFQTVELAELDTPGERRILTDKRFGNKVVFLELEPQDGGKRILMRFEVQRREKSAYGDEPHAVESYLSAEEYVPDRQEFRTIASEVTEGKHNDLMRARALYDHTIDRMRYMKFGEGFGQGDALYACDARTGNCTDFHSYFIALARACGIPARFAIGAAVPSDRQDGGVDGYHCWAEFYADGQWWPVDISEADKYSNLATYYFGHHPANRIEFSRGRDLIVEPGPVSGPINFLAYPVLEVAGEPVPVKPQFGFRRLAQRDVKGSGWTD